MKKNSLLESIDPIYIENLQSQNHFSVFSVEDDYQILIVRGFTIDDDELVFNSKGFIITKEHDVYMYSDGKLIKNELKFHDLDEILEPIYEKNLKIIDELVREVDRLEDSLFDRKTSRIFMDNWFDLKKLLSRIERYYSRNLVVLQALQKYYVKEKDFSKSSFQDFLHDVNYTIHHVETQTNRLDAIYNYHGSIKSDKLNNNLYALTVLSAVFLPLNLVVGFFGMNTENLFFKDNVHGTQYVVFILIGMFLLAFVGIPLIRLMDKYLLRFILGKSHIYRKVSSKINKIEEILKVD